MGGEDVLGTLEKLLCKDGTEQPVKPVKKTEFIVYEASPRWCLLLRRTLYRYQDPFEDYWYKIRLVKILTKKAEAQNSAGNQPTTAQVSRTYVRLSADRTLVITFIFSCRHARLPTSFHLTACHVL